MPKQNKINRDHQPTLIETVIRTPSRFEKEADRIIQAEINIRKPKFKWSNDEEAFAHLFTQYRFDVDEEDAAQDCQMGRAGHDKGIDAYRLEDDHDSGTGTLYIVQTKSSRSVYEETVLYADVKKAVDFLRKDNLEGIKSTLGEVLEAFRESVKKKYDIVFVLGLNGNADKVRATLPDFEATLAMKCQIEIFDVDDIRALVMRPKHISVKGPTVVFENLPTAPWMLSFPNSPRVISCAVRAQEIGRHVRSNRLSIFGVNVREYLGSTNPVNRVVAESLRKNPLQFHYLNLGIDAVCEQVSISEYQELDGSRKWSLQVPNFQIVNGCQTAKTISEIEVDPNAFVLLRLIEVEEKDEREKLVPDISVAKNRQSPIHGRDLFAWHPSQKRLKKELEGLGYFFETREREWDAFSKHQTNANKLYPNGRLINTDAARAYLAVYLQQPFRSKHRKKDFFLLAEDGGVFEKLFVDTPAQQMLLAYNIYQFVTGKCHDARKKFSELSYFAVEHELSDDDEYKMEEANVIWNGDTFLASLIGFFLGKHYGLRLSDDTSLLLTEHLLRQIPKPSSTKALELLFDFAREITI